MEALVGMRKDLILYGDKTGAYSADVPPGFYDVPISFPAFEPSCRKVRVRPGESDAVSPKLSVSGLVSKELD